MTTFRIGDTHLDLPRRTMKGPDGTEPLTSTEAALLGWLAERADTPVPKQELLRNVWGYHSAVRSRTVDTTVSRIRAKLRAVGPDDEALTTVRGSGVLLSGATRLADPLTVPTPGSAPLVGRDGVLGHLRSALEVDRLVTLVGPPGVGKTALARTHAAACGGLWCDLREATTLGEVLTALRSVAGLESLVEDIEAIGRPLGRAAPLIVLDNAEQLPSPVGELAERLSAHIRVVVTSQRRLGVPEERVIPVTPLSPTDAAALLTDRILRLGLVPEPDTLRRVCERLDGLPLELELIAPSVALFGESGLASHASGLDAALGRSFALLSDARRELLVQLAVFHAGFDLAAVATVTARPPTDLVPELMDLQQRSLVRAEPGHRFALLRAVRQWVAGRRAEPLVRARAAAEAGLVVWCASLRDRLLTDGPAPLRRHRADLGWALGRPATPDELSGIAHALLDLSSRSPREPLRDDLAHAAARLPDDIVVNGFLQQSFEHPDRWYPALAAARPPDAYRRTMLVVGANLLGHVEEERQWVSLALAALPQESRAMQVRLGLDLAARAADAEWQQIAAHIGELVALHGWAFAGRCLAATEIGRHVFAGRYEQALAEGSRSSGWTDLPEVLMWLALAATLSGRLDEARIHVDALKDPAHGMGTAAAFYQGVIDLLSGDPDGAARRLGDIALLPRQLGDAARGLITAAGWVPPLPIGLPAVRAILDGDHASFLDDRRLTLRAVAFVVGHLRA